MLDIEFNIKYLFISKKIIFDLFFTIYRYNESMSNTDLKVKVWRGAQEGEFVEYLVPRNPNQTVLDVDPSGISTSQVAHQLFIRRWILKRVFLNQRQKLLCFGLEPRRSQFGRVLLRMLGKDQLPTHQSNSLAHSSTDSAMPSLMDSRMPGTDNKYSVS